MKKISIIMSIIIAFSAIMIFVGCESQDKKETATQATFKEPTITVSESATFSFKKNTSTTKATKPKVKPKTKATEKTTAYVEKTTEYVEYTQAYTEEYTEAYTEENYGYIDYSGASSRNLTESDVYGVDADTVQSVINDIYAHHGYIFQTPSIREYYESQSWYNGTTTSQAEAEAGFNSYESYNKDFLSKYR